MKSDWKRQLHALAILGAVVAVLGYLRYETQNENTPLTEGLMIGGGIAFLIAVALNYKELVTFFSRRSSRLGTNTLTVTVLVLVVVGLLNFLGYRHHKRVDLTTEQLYTLSDQSRRIAGGLQKDVDVLRFSKTADPNFKDTMTEYISVGPHIHYRDVDPQEHPELAKQYSVTHLDQVVVASGAHNEILSDTTEQDITNAIVKVTRDTIKTVCFLEGHAEKDIAADDADGFSKVAGGLKNEGYMTTSVNLVTAHSVPSDCNVFVVAGPKQSLLPQESQAIQKYLDDGGKALFLLDPETEPKLDDVLQPWNIKLGSNVVVDLVGQMFGSGAQTPLVINYGPSPITTNFNGTMTFFPLVRTVDIADKTKTQPQDIELLKTSERSFTIPHLVHEVHFDPKTDTIGPLSLGIAAQRNADEVSGSKSSRLVVIGNSAFADNEWAGQQRNGDLFLNTINWLAQDENLISIRPKSPTNRRVILTATQQRELQLVTLIFLPGIVMVSGGFIWLRRR